MHARSRRGSHRSSVGRAEAMGEVAPGTGGRDRPLVTVTLVTYHGERWLETCIGSVLAQSEPAWELLVLDNASTDGTWDALAG